MMPVVNDHYSAKMSNLSLGSSTADNKDKPDTESTIEKRILKPSKSDSSLSVRDKTSSVSREDGVMNSYSKERES